LYRLPLSETDYEAIDAFMAAQNRIKKYLEVELGRLQSVGFVDLVRAWEDIAPDFRGFTARRLTNLARLRNGLAHDATEVRKYRSVPSLSDIKAMEGFAESITRVSVPPYRPPQRPEKYRTSSSPSNVVQSVIPESRVVQPEASTESPPSPEAFAPPEETTEPETPKSVSAKVLLYSSAMAFLALTQYAMEHGDDIAIVPSPSS
jgi:hypothetical protein